MANRFEPRVLAKRIDTSVSATINATKATTYIGIEAETGPYDLQEITSTKNLINKYSTSGKPSRDAGITMLHAGKFTQQFVAHCLRVNKDVIHVGIDSVGNTLFFDENYKLIDTLTSITLSTERKNISNQPLMVIINGVLYYNTQAASNEDDLGAVKFYEYKENSDDIMQWVDISHSTKDYPNRKDTIATWIADGKEYHEIAATDSDRFLDIVYNSYLFKDERFISYSNYSDRVLMLSGSPEAEYSGNWDKLVQWDPNFSATKENDNTGSLITAANDGVSEDGTEFTNQNDLSHLNKLFRPIKNNEDYSNNNQIVFNGTSYYSNGNAPAKKTNTSNSCQLVGSKVDSVVRDSVLSALNGIYNNETKKPSSFVDQSVVIKSPAGYIFLGKNGTSGTMTSKVTGDLEGKIEMSVISFDELPSSITPWIKIEDYTSPMVVTAAMNNYLKISFKGNVSVVNNGSVDLVLGHVNSAGQLEYSLLSFKVGNTSTAQATMIDLAKDLGTTDKVVNAIVPNLIASYSVIGWEEQLPTEFAAKSTEEDRKTQLIDCYYKSNVNSILINVINSTFSWTGYELNQVSILNKTQNQLNLKYAFKPQADSMEKNSIDGANYLVVGKEVFFNKSQPTIDNPDLYSFHQISKKDLTTEEFITKVREEMYSYFKMVVTNDGKIIINGNPDKLDIPCNTDQIKCDWFTTNQSSEAKFAVVQKFTSKSALSQFEIEIDEDDNDIIYLHNAHGSESYKDTISFDPNKVNGYGVNIYFDKFNRLQRAFHVTELNGSALTNFTTPIFGNEIKPKKATIQDYIDALEVLKNDGFKPLFLFDAGLCNTQYYKSLASFGEEIHATVPVSMPDGSVSDVTAFKSALGFATEEVCYDGWQRDVVFGDVSFDCCPGYYYLQLVLSNTNSVAREFEPIFHKAQGRIETSDPTRERTKGERESLLDANINSIVRHKTDGYSYFNSNYTNQSYESDFSEEQNVRISNKITHIADGYIDVNVLGKYNSPALWTKVQKTLEGLIDEGIMKNRTNNTATSFRVVCDETNNDANTRKLVVDIYVTYGKSIIEALVYSRTATLEG